MSETSLFKDDILSHKLSRKRPTAAYVDQMSSYLKRRYPDCSDEFIEKFIKNTVTEKIKRPRVKMLVHPEYGVTRESVEDLLTGLDPFNKDIITPSGAIYMPPSVKESLISQMIDSKVAERNIYKKEMLDAAAVGDSVREIVSKNLQASAKIFNNSIPGAMGTPYSFLFDLPGYNAITSIGQQSVKVGYGHIERMLAGNMYLPSIESIINFVHTLTRHTPTEQVRTVLSKYNLHKPTVDEVADDLLDCLSLYRNIDGCREPVVKCLSVLTEEERAFLTYAYCYWNLIKYNKDFVRKYLTEFFSRNGRIDKAWEASEIFDVEEDMLNMAMSLNFDVINNDPKLWNAVKEYPDAVVKLLSICRHMDKCLHDIGDLITVFFKLNYNIPGIWKYPNIVRKCVAVSDTDSAIFQTKDIVEWYTPDNLFCQDAYDINAFSVFLLSQSLEHIFGRLATAIGAEGKKRGLIKMKNEFYYPIFIRTTKGKHYLGQILIQEGKILPKPKKDIKGVQFRGSNLPSIVGDRFEQYFDWVCETLTTGDGLISINDLLSRVVEFELEMHKSLTSGEKKYLPTAQVRVKTEYPEPMKTNYFYYMLWDEVFAPTFGEFVIPNKGYSIPVVSSNVFTSAAFHAELAKVDPKLSSRLKEFTAKYPQKKINSIILPPTLAEVPEVLRSIMDTRKIIFTCTRSFSLLLNQLRLSFNDVKTKYLIADFVSDSGMNVKNTKK